MKKIKVGLLGFGKTGRIVADNFYNDPTIDLLWVIKRHVSDIRKKYPYSIKNKKQLSKKNCIEILTCLVIKAQNIN